jgi:hypothetical protein
MVINYPDYLLLLLLHFILLLKTFPSFLGIRICLEMVLQLFTNYLGIVCVKLATERKLHRVSTYLPNLEALCLECVWNTCLATTNSSPRLRPPGGQKYIPLSPLDSYVFYWRLRNTQEVTADWLKVLPMTQTTSLTFPDIPYIHV